MPPGFSGFVEPGLSFSPEKTQIELACDVAASFGVRLPGGPITSLAKAALALAPVRAAAQTATASNDLLRMAFLLSIWARRRRRRRGRFVSWRFSPQAGGLLLADPAACTRAHVLPGRP